jgi:hypothetical protein
MTRPAIIAALLCAIPAHADTLNLSGTTIRIAPPTTQGAIAQVEFWNSPVNQAHHNGNYTVTGQGITLDVQFIWDHSWTSDTIIVTPPDGVICDPHDCTLTLEESTGGTIWLYDTRGVGM